MSDNNGGNPRLDRIESILETMVNVQSDMQQEHQMLLRAQVVQGDELRQLAKRTDERFQALTAAQERMDERLTAAQERLTAAQERLTGAQERMDDALTALMGTVDEIIRKPRS
jgi:chromosome segregation ATPase